MHHLHFATYQLDIFDFMLLKTILTQARRIYVSRFKSVFYLFSAAFGGMQPLGRSPMRSSRRSLSYTSIKAVIDSVSTYSFLWTNSDSFEEEGFNKESLRYFLHRK